MEELKEGEKEWKGKKGEGKRSKGGRQRRRMGSRVEAGEGRWERVEKDGGTEMVFIRYAAH